MNNRFVQKLAVRALCGAPLLLALHVGSAWAGLTDISDVPMIGSNSVPIKPNIMLVVDTSNSMSWTHMPDQMEVAGATQMIGYKSSKCNSLYYDPAKVYLLPRDSANATLPNPSFTAAPYNYYSSDTTTVDLSKAFQAHDANTVQNGVTSLADTAQPAYYFVYSGTATNFSYNARPCNDANSTSTSDIPTTGGKWTRTLISTTAQKTNFAIWYTYYRTRIALAKSAIGRAFAPLSDNYRVGLITVNPNTTLSGGVVTATDTVQDGHYTAIADFDATQRTLWYSNFYGQVPGGSSPAREALARVGRHYAGRTDGINKGMSQDPVQYACQPNFAIMTTDGYWNTAAETTGVGGGPTNINGNAWVGQQDSPLTNEAGLVPRGVYDGTSLQLGYWITGTASRHITYGTCSYTTSGYTNTTVSKTITPMVKKVVITQQPDATKWQGRIVSIQQQTYTITKEVLQYWKKGTTAQKTTLSNTWYNPGTEKYEPVASCSGLTGCTPTTKTEPVTLPLTCTDSLPVAPNFETVQCTGVVDQLQTKTCTPSPASCYTVPITSPGVLVADGSCNSGSSGSPNYYFTTCTKNLIAPTVFVNSYCTPTYTAASNVVCSYVATPPAWMDTVAPAVCTPGAVPGSPNSTQECQQVNYCTAGTAANGACGSSTTYSHSDTVACVESALPVGTVTTCIDGTVANGFPPVGPVPVDPATCTKTVNPSLANQFNTTTCDKVSNNFSGTCFASPAVAPNWLATTCRAKTTATDGWNSSYRDTTYPIWTYDIDGIPHPQTKIVGGSTPLTLCAPPPNPTPDIVDYPLPDLTPIRVEGSLNGGSTNSLADVAQYYYATDLRPSMDNIVKPANVKALDDRAIWQHMTTYVVGLGVSGTMAYQPASATSGAFSNIVAGTGSWPVWPDPTITYTGNDALYNAPRSIDDFWHAAVNGRGKYFSANDPDSVVAGIQVAIDGIDATLAAGSSLTISDQAGSTINGLFYETTYTTVDWTGDLRAQVYSASLTSLSPYFWQAQKKLQTQVQADCDDRKIFVRTTAGTSHLQEFTASTKKCSDLSVSSSLSSTMLARISATGLSQYALMTTGSSGSVNQRTQATAASLVNYLRGQSQNEGYLAGTSGKLYRTRSAALGDIVGSKSQYVAAPYRDYLDAGYASFKAAQSARTPMVYVGGNDGMLHAFYAPAATATGATLATAGTEAWAYIPTIVIDNLSKLADINYKSNHRFFVDGTPLVSDVKFSDGEWHTILVGGLNKGGKGFYALDVTDPAAPVSLWEFDSSNCSPGGCSVGYSFGVPVIGKLANGTWAVFLTSGYNNSTGQATLFVLNAQSGASIKSMNAGSGSASDPSGLAKISAWSNYPGVDDTVQNVYGGDLQGNIWRFDVNSDSATTAVLLGVAKDSAGARQSITTAPEVGLVKGKRYVFVGTGRLLGVGDLDRTQTQSVYGLYDSLVTTDNTTALRSVLKGLRTTSDYTIECSPDSATSCKDVNEKGYVIDLVGANEQIILPLTLIGSTLTIVSNQPKEGSCGSGSKSSVYFAKGNDGSTVEAGLGLPVGAVGVTYVNGEEQTVIGYPRTDPLAPPIDPFVVPSGISPLVGANRASWRGIMQQQ